MKFKTLLAVALASAAMGVSAQTHKEGVEYYKADQLENAKELLNRHLNNAGTDKSVANYYLGLIAVAENDLAGARSISTQVYRQILNMHTIISDLEQ